MSTPLLFKCCGGIWFIHVPFFGHCRFDAAAGILGVVAAFVLLVAGSVQLCVLIARRTAKSPLRAGFEAAVVSALVSVALGPLGAGAWVLSQYSSAKGSVQGAVAEHLTGVVRPSQRIRGFRELESTIAKLSLGGGGGVVKQWLAPRNIPGLLSPEEARAAADTILHQRAEHLIHLDAQAGPLPFLTYGSYWGYLHYDPAHRPADSRLKGKPSQASSHGQEDESFERIRNLGNTASTTNPPPPPPPPLLSTATAAAAATAALLPPRRQCAPGAPVSSDCFTYQQAVALHRGRLLRDFGYLYDRLCAQLSAHLGGQPVRLLPGNASAPPGFQIWLPNRVWAWPVFHLHSDETFKRFLVATNKATNGAVFDAILAATGSSRGEVEEGEKGAEGKLSGAGEKWEIEELCDMESRISFTMPVALPASGGGLNFVDFSNTTSADCFGQTKLSNCGRVTKEIYEVGTLYVHNATMLHQIAPWPFSAFDTAPRITFQGFGFNCGGTWYLYW